MNASDSSENGGDALARHRALLDRLATLEHDLAVLEELESDLEVEQISADVALEAATAKRDFGISRDAAAAVAAARARKRELEAALTGQGEPPNAGAAELEAEIERNRAGREALEAWREAPATAAAWRRPRVINPVIAAACAAAVWAAVSLHPVFLVLLVPLLMAVAYFTFTAGDADWVRLGAMRRFQGTRLEPPSSWARDTVGARIDELSNAQSRLEQRLAEAESSPDERRPRDRDADELEISVELVDAADAYAAALARAGIETQAVDEQLFAWLDLVHEAQRLDAELSQARTRRKTLSREAEEARDAVFRFLALAGEAPPNGRADAASLRAGLDRVSRRGG